MTERPPLCVSKGGGGTLVRGRNRCSAWASVGVRVKCNWPFQKKMPVRHSSVHTGSKNNMECNLRLLCILNYAPWLSFIIQGSMSHYGMHTTSSALKSKNKSVAFKFLFSVYYFSCCLVKVELTGIDSAYLCVFYPGKKKLYACFFLFVNQHKLLNTSVTVVICRISCIQSSWHRSKRNIYIS